jgi:hypothetical protein
MTERDRTIILRGAGPMDFIFEHDALGMFNVTRANEIVAAARKMRVRDQPTWVYPVRLSFSADFIGYLGRCIDPDRFARLRDDQLARPGIGVMTPMETMLLLDGHHRALRRVMRGRDSYYVIVLPVAYYAALQVSVTVTEGGNA